MITRLLVANRGEIARRVFRTCRELGIETVAVFADPDADSPHVVEADLAFRMDGSTATQTYLRGDLIVEAALKTGADAVHPGYGFLAENAAFAAAVIDAGLTWVGPPPEAIAAMGDKLAAKALLARAGVPMLPSVTAPDAVRRFPVLVKAAAGGGGRGMRIARTAEELGPALDAARREALAAFGDDTVFCERLVENGRHIEVQLLADAHGTIVALGERECSIQRRHQKIIEETPAPAVSPSLRESLHDAALAVARAVGYVGAGTVEFLLETHPSGAQAFYFLEMNTRLQVEHPVTEAVTGLDLVALQLAIAAGEPLPFTTAPPPVGHALEVRLYAESPDAGWLPSTGPLHRFAIPTDGGVRVDSGVVDGSVVSPHFDPMLAKVIAHAPTRAAAARRLGSALRRAHLHGVATNRDLLVRILDEDDFLAGALDTGYLDHHPSVFEPLLDDRQLALAGLAAALARSAAPQPAWGNLPTGWRNVRSAPSRVSFDRIDVSWTLDRAGSLIGHDGVSLVSRAPDLVVLLVDSLRTALQVHTVDDVSYVDSPWGSVALTLVDPLPRPVTIVAEGSLRAPMPGTVGATLVKVGASVAAGDPLLTLEAMKLEHTIAAPTAGVVAELPVAPGDQVATGAILAVVHEGEPA